MKILVVDDEPDVEFLFQQKFRKELRNHKVELAFALSGEAALNYLESHEHEIILILSDINMPGMTGLELLKQVKQKYDAPPPIVMMITAYGDEQSHDQAIQLGADDFLTKPLDFALLKQKLKIDEQGA